MRLWVQIVLLLALASLLAGVRFAVGYEADFAGRRMETSTGREVTMPRLVAFWLLTLGVAATFLWAASTKLKDPAGFCEAITAYRLLPESASVAATYLLPTLEGLAALAFLTPWLRSGGAAILAGLLVVFIAALASAWGRGLDIDCGCFAGSGETGRYAEAILRNLLLLFACGYLMREEVLRLRRKSAPHA